MNALFEWQCLVENLNGRSLVGQVGVRDPDALCDLFDGRGYDGRGDCYSDGHYLCTDCSHLSSEAPRFQNEGGRADRLRLFWNRPR